MGENRYFRVIVYSLMALVFLIPFSWLALYTACLPWPQLCKIPNIWTFATLTPILLILGLVGSAYRARALRAARGRTQARPMVGTSYGLQLPSIFPSYQANKLDMLDEKVRGWQVPFDSGISINVYKVELREWIRKAYERQPRLTGKQSAISWRNNTDLGIDQHKARIFLLDQANAIKRKSNSSNSTPYLKDRGRKEAFEMAHEITEDIEIKYQKSMMIF